MEIPKQKYIELNPIKPRSDVKTTISSPNSLPEAIDKLSPTTSTEQQQKEMVDKFKKIIPSLELKRKGKNKIVNGIDLDEDILIQKWDQSNISIEDIDILGELWKKGEKQKMLRVKRDR